MKGIATVAMAVLLSTAIGGVFFSDSQAANQPGVLISKKSPSPSPTPRPPRRP